MLELMLYFNEWYCRRRYYYYCCSILTIVHSSNGLRFAVYYITRQLRGSWCLSHYQHRRQHFFVHLEIITCGMIVLSWKTLSSLATTNLIVNYCMMMLHGIVLLVVSENTHRQYTLGQCDELYLYYWGEMKVGKKFFLFPIPIHFRKTSGHHVGAI